MNVRLGVIVLAALLAGCASPPRASTTNQQVWSFADRVNEDLAIPAELIVNDPEVVFETGPIARSPAPGVHVVIQAFVMTRTAKTGRIEVQWLDRNGASIGGSMHVVEVRPGGAVLQVKTERAPEGTARVRMGWDTVHAPVERTRAN